MADRFVAAGVRVGLINQTASISATTLGLPVGLWRVMVYHIETDFTPAVAPGTPGTLATTIRWIDTGINQNTKPAADIALDYPGWKIPKSGSVIIHVTDVAGGSPTYETVVTPPSSGAGTYSLAIFAELVGTI